jgi:hypothetical protein
MLLTLKIIFLDNKMSAGFLAARGNGNTAAPGQWKDDGQKRVWWFFTWNNYVEKDCGLLASFFLDLGAKYCFGEEIAPTTGTPHLQGFVKFAQQKRLKTIRNDLIRFFGHSKLSWSPSRNREACYDYCEKDGIVYKNMERPTNRKKKLSPMEEDRREVLQQYDGVEWRPWQRHVLDTIERELVVPNSRVVHWYWETVGNTGKSFLADYLNCKYDTVIADGKKADIFNQLLTMREKYKKRCEVIIVDIPRTNEGWVNYGTLEALKNRTLVSGKYEGGKVYLPQQPPVVVFANFEPNYMMMSADRWDVVNVGIEEEEVFGSPDLPV